MSKHFDSNKRSFSEGNKGNTLKESNFKKQQKEKEIFGEIIERKIHIDGSILLIKYILPKNSNSCTKNRSTNGLSVDAEEKVGFDEWLLFNTEKHKFIESEFFKLLIEIFDKRFRIYPNNICDLSPFGKLCKKNIELFCQKHNELSIYVLYVLNSQFIPFFKYMNEKINFKNLKPNKYEEIKEIVEYIGKDIKNIFKFTFASTGMEKINFSNLLGTKLEDYLVKNNLKEEKKIKNSLLYKEKENFENYLNTINDMKFQKDYGICIDKNLYIEKENEQTNINKNTNDINNTYNTSNNDNLKTQKSQNNENNNNNNGFIQNLAIDDLMNYINEPKAKNNNKKKKKKKKNKGKKAEKNDDDDNENIDDLNEDIVIIDYKKSLEEFSQSLSNSHKIRPKYSEKFLRFLTLINN
jgi:hypothetical protein